MEGKAVKNKYSLSLMLIALFMSSLAGQSKDHLSESNVNKDRLPKVKKDSFAEAMKEIEEIRERDIAKEILRREDISRKLSYKLDMNRHDSRIIFDCVLDVLQDLLLDKILENTKIIL